MVKKSNGKGLLKFTIFYYKINNHNLFQVKSKSFYGDEYLFKKNRCIAAITHGAELSAWLRRLVLLS